jgi:hypothetical protein
MKTALEKPHCHAVAALKLKQAALLGEIELLQKQLYWREQQLEHVTGTLQVFGHRSDQEAQPIRAYRRIPLFKQGELCRLVRDTLREAGKPLSSAEIVKAITAKLGHDDDAIPAFRHRVNSSLTYLMNARHEVRKDGNRVNVKWRLR